MESQIGAPPRVFSIIIACTCFNISDYLDLVLKRLSCSRPINFVFGYNVKCFALSCILFAVHSGDMFPTKFADACDVTCNPVMEHLSINNS